MHLECRLYVCMCAINVEMVKEKCLGVQSWCARRNAEQKRAFVKCATNECQRMGWWRQMRCRRTKDGQVVCDYRWLMKECVLLPGPRREEVLMCEPAANGA